MKTIAITIEEDTLRRIDQVAGARGQSTTNRSKFIREAINQHLSEIEKASEEQLEREIFKRNRGKLRREALALIKEQAKR